jgi:hypothetical protein
MTSAKRFAKIIFMIMLVLIPVSGICGCGSVQQEKTEQKEIHVSAAGSDETRKEGATMSNKGHIGCGRGLCKSGKKE